MSKLSFRPRTDLHDILKTVLDNSNVYFRPPANKLMKYPAIRYDISEVRTTYADNKRYKIMKGYTVTLITLDPDTDVFDKILETFEYCRFDRSYAYDNLHHFVFNVYF